MTEKGGAVNTPVKKSLPMYDKSYRYPGSGVPSGEYEKASRRVFKLESNSSCNQILVIKKVGWGALSFHGRDDVHTYQYCECPVGPRGDGHRVYIVIDNETVLDAVSACSRGVVVNPQVVLLLTENDEWSTNVASSHLSLIIAKSLHMR
jgi:hypothetical protein